MRLRSGPALALALALIGCQRTTTPTAAPNGSGKPAIVVTWSVLGALVREVVGDRAAVSVLIPNGLDPHEWEPSARDIERLRGAELVVENGLGLEAGMEKSLRQARAAGVAFFTCSEHAAVRAAGGAPDPHLWMDPLTMEEAMNALAARMQAAFGIDLGPRAKDLAGRLEALDAAIRSELSSIPPADRRLVTGHASMGYFAQRYGFDLLGAIVPSLSTQAEVSAGDLARLRELVGAAGVKSVFIEVGSPKAVAEALARDAGVRVLPLATHALPPDGSYFTFMQDLARAVASGLQ